MRLAAAVIFGLLAVFAGLPLFADTPPRIETFTLANGLEVIILPNHRIPAISQMVWYRIGAADDPPGKSGLAHYHEHTMFLGTDRHKSGDYANIVAAHGGQENAFTGYDATSYFIDIAKDQLPLAMELEADRMRPLKPTPEDMAREKQVILEERRMRIENNPDALLSEQMNAALFRNHPYHWPVIGWMHEMEGLLPDDVLKFHQKWYHPNNAILILSGDITAAEARPLVEKYYGSLAKMPVPPRRWNEEPPQIAARRIVMHHKNVRQPEWARNYAAPSLNYGKSEESLPLYVLAHLLGEGKTSRLYQSLVVDQKLASGISTDYSGFSLGPSEFEVSITPEKDVPLEKLEAALDKELARVLKDGFSDSDLARAKTQLKAESVYARDGLSSMARIMGWIRISGLPTDYFTHWPQMIDAITMPQILAAARDTLKPEQSVTAYLLPEEAPAPEAAKEPAKQPVKEPAKEPAKGAKP